MGQAKLRGSREERVAQAKAAAAAAKEIRDAEQRARDHADDMAYQARIDAMTPEERGTLYTRRRRVRPMAFLAAASALGVGYFG